MALRSVIFDGLVRHHRSGGCLLGLLNLLRRQHLIPVVLHPLTRQGRKITGEARAVAQEMAPACLPRKA